MSKLCAALVVASVVFAAQTKAQGPLLETMSLSRQMVVVTTKDWTATDGTLRYFERKAQGWEQVGTAMPVVVGRSGMGWGRGMTNQPADLVPNDPQKHEGDGRSPAGIFYLPYAFGYAAPEDVTEIKMPYIQCTSSVECIDDTNSTYYNIIKDRKTVAKPDWKSSEKMKMADDEYKLGIFVAHNAGPVVPGAGSCVFMHIWKGPGKPTSGCTAMKEGSMEALLGWLDGASKPVLVQLPEPEYLKRKKNWLLPAIQF